MTRNGSWFESAAETFENAGLPRAESEVYVARAVLDMSRSEAAEYLGKSENTIDNQLAAAREDVRLPEISKIDTAARVGADRDPAVEIWFSPGNKALRYRWDDERGEIREETYFQGTVEQSYGVGGEPQDLAEYALKSVGEYVQSYRDDPDAMRQDWPDVWGLLTA